MEKLKVIYVDDDAVNVILMKGLSDELEWNFKGYTSSAKAISTLNRENFDVIFSDLQMPDINGLDLIYIIRSNTDNPNLKTPIYIVTGSPTGKEAEKCKTHDISGVIAKPFTEDVLRDISEKLLNNKIK